MVILWDNEVNVVIQSYIYTAKHVTNVDGSHNSIVKQKTAGFQETFYNIVESNLKHLPMTLN